MNAELMNRLALQAGGAHFPDVFKQNQESYTRQVLIECYGLMVMQNAKQSPQEYLAIDFMFDIQKHFGVDLTAK